jgi:hypothetical protein
MKRWWYYLWWKTKAVRRLIELTNCKPWCAIRFVRDITQTQVDPFIWVPANPEKFIEFKVKEMLTNYKFVKTVDELQNAYDDAKKGDLICYGVNTPRRPIMRLAAKLSPELFQKRVGNDLFHYLIRKI